MTELLPISRIPSIGLPPRALVVGDPFRAERIAARLKSCSKVAHAREYLSFRGVWQGSEVVVASHGVGGPGALCLFQELADAGVRTIVRLGTAGAMQAGIDSGDLVIAEAAVRDDGVTYQLLPSEYPAVANPEVVLALAGAAKRAGAPAHRGLIWTRAAFYPAHLELPMKAYINSRVLAIEMELSALLILGSMRGLRCGGVLVIDGAAADDLMDTTGYNPHRESVMAGVERGIEVALDALVQLPDAEANDDAVEP